YEMWKEDMLYNIALSMGDDQYGEMEIEFVPQCFVAGTAVASEGGLVAIESLCLGDNVWAWSQNAEQTVLRPVLRCFVHASNELVILAIGTNILGDTPEHPFLTPDRGWVAAGELKAGDHLVTAGGLAAVVDSTQRHRGDFLVYNFEVAIDH